MKKQASLTAIDDASMHDIEKSISSGSNAFETSPKQRKKSPLGAVMLIAIAIAIYAGSGLLPSAPQIVESPVDAVTAENEGKLVHITGEIVSDISDPMFNISEKAIRLERVVQMLQWVQEGDKYSRRWEDKVIAIQGDEPRVKGLINPLEMPFSSDKWEATEVKIGAFSLAPELVKQLPEAQDMPLGQEHFDKMSDEGKLAFKLDKGSYFFGLNPETPRIGEIRVLYKKIAAGTVSIIAQQKGSTLVPLQSENGAIGKLMPGAHDLSSMSDNMGLSTSPYIQYAIKGVAGILLLFGLVGLLKTIRLPKREKTARPSKQAPMEEEHFEEGEYSPEAEDNTEIEEAIEDFEEDFEPPQVLEPHVLNTTPPPPPSNDQLDFNQADEDDEIPPGIEMVGPDGLITEEFSNEESVAAIPPLPPPPVEFYAEEAEDEDDDEMPAGIEMIGPGSITSGVEQNKESDVVHDENLEPWQKFANMEYPPQPEAEPEPMEPDEYQAAGNVSTSLEFTPGEYVSSEPTDLPKESPVYSDYELSAAPSEFASGTDTNELYTPPLGTPSAIHEPLEFTSELYDETDEEEAEDYPPAPESDDFVPESVEYTPQPLDYTPEPIAVEEVPFDSDYLPPEFEPEDEAAETESSEFEYLEGEEGETESLPADFLPVPPLPMPAFLTEGAATSSSSFVPEEATFNEPAQPIGGDDIFSSLLSSIPDDFDPTAEMETPPPPPAESEDEEGTFDPFDHDDDTEFSPFAVHDEEKK